MQTKTKDRLKVEVLEHGQGIVMLIVGAAVAVGLDALFGHDRRPAVIAVVVVAGVGASMAAGTVLSLLLADLRGRLYEAAGVTDGAPSAELTD